MDGAVRGDARGASAASAPPALEATPAPTQASESGAAPPVDLSPELVGAVPRDIESVYALWPAVVELVRSEHALLGAVIGEARPVEVDGEELTLAYPFSAEFYKKKAEDPANRATVGEALGALAGGRWRLRYELRDTPEAAVGEGADGRSEEQWVEHFIDEFDAEELTEEGSELSEPGPLASTGETEDERGAGTATSNEKGA